MNQYEVANLARLEPAYQQRLGLNTAPFPPTHEDRFLYLDAERLQRLNMLQHLTQYSNLLLIVRGERGIGKTSLMQRLIVNARPEWHLCQIDANTMMDANQLLYQIARGFGLPAPPHDDEALQEVLYQQLVNLRQRDEIPLLLVDDAHELAQEALQALFNLADIESGDGKLLRVILFCEPQIETMLDQPAIHALRDRVTHTLDIPRLSEEQTAEYLRHRLSVAGLLGASPFQLRDIHHIYKLSDGVPANINEAAHDLLSQEPTAQGKQPPAQSRKFRPVHWLIGLLSLGLLLLLVFQEVVNTRFEPTAPDRQASAPVVEIQSPVPPSAAHDSPASPTPPETQPQAPAEPTQPPAAAATVATKPEVTKPSPAPAATVQAGRPPSGDAELVLAPPLHPVGDNPPVPTPSAPPAAAPPTAPRILAISPNPAIGSQKPQTFILKGDGLTKDTKVRVQWKQGDKILAAHQVEWRNEHEMRLILTTGLNGDNWQVALIRGGQRSAPASFAVKPPAPPSQSAGPPRTAIKTRSKHSGPVSLWDKDWLSAQPGQHLTLQLLASRQRASIEKFARQHALSGRAVAFTSQRDGEPLYTLVLGSYADRNKAKQAIAQLPTHLQSIKPWTRSFNSIHAALSQQALTLSPTTPPGSQQRREQSAWLWSQDPRRFTLQLMSGRNENAIRQFIRQHKLSGKAVYFRSLHDGQTRYALVFGSYPDRNSALAAIPQLPGSLRKPKPWPRSFSSIQAELLAP